MLIKFAVCDDEPLMAQKICEYISTYMQEGQNTAYHISSFSNGRLLLESPCDFNVIFLDIQMEQPNGMETAKILRQGNIHCLLIFITVLKEQVFDAFEVQAYDYFVKPIDHLHFKKMMDRAMVTLQQYTSKPIVIQRGNSCEVIQLSQILYCEVHGRKIYIHQEDGKIVDYYERLNDFERCVDGRFFRCHRSCLVILHHVRGSRFG